MSNYKAYLHKIKAFAFDVDGVFTDGSVQVSTTGDLLRTYNAKDGYAIRYASDKGYPIAIITGGASETIKIRFKMLGVSDVYLGARHKLPCFEEFCTMYDLKPEEVLYLGDDIPDIEIMEQCGLAVCPADAVAEVKAVVAHISTYEGGKGCVRDIVEQVLKVHDKWKNDDHIAST